MIFRDQLTLGRLPLLLVLGTIAASVMVLLQGFRVLNGTPPVLQLPDVTAVSRVEPYRFNEDYCTAFGAQFIRVFGNWNRYNMERQLLITRSMGSNAFKQQMQEYLASNMVSWQKLRATRMSRPIETKLNWIDHAKRQCELLYLVRQNEWWGGQLQSSKLIIYTLEIGAQSGDADNPYLVEILGMSAKDVTPADDKGDPDLLSSEAVLGLEGADASDVRAAGDGGSATAIDATPVTSVPTEPPASTTPEPTTHTAPQPATPATGEGTP